MKVEKVEMVVKVAKDFNRKEHKGKSTKDTKYGIISLCPSCLLSVLCGKSAKKSANLRQ